MWDLFEYHQINLKFLSKNTSFLSNLYILPFTTFYFYPNAKHLPVTLLAFIDKYGIPTNHWTWLYDVLLEVSVTKIALWIVSVQMSGQPKVR